MIYYKQEPPDNPWLNMYMGQHIKILKLEEWFLLFEGQVFWPFVGVELCWLRWLGLVRQLLLRCHWAVDLRFLVFCKEHSRKLVFPELPQFCHCSLCVPIWSFLNATLNILADVRLLWKLGARDTTVDSWGWDCGLFHLDSLWTRRGSGMAKSCGILAASRYRMFTDLPYQTG